MGIPFKRRMPKDIGSILGPQLKKRGLSASIKQARIFEVWTEAAGKVIADNCEVVSINKGVVVLRPKSPTWANELLYQKAALIKKLNQHLGRGVVKDIKFTQASPKVVTSSLVTQYKPDANRKPKEVQASPAELKEIEASLTEIKDPELKKTLSSMFKRGATK